MNSTRKKRIEAEKNGDKDEKNVVQINEQCRIWKKYGKLKIYNRCKTCKQQKDYLKWTSKPSNMSHKIFHNDLVTIRKNKVTLMLDKPAYIGMCILELSKVLIYDYIKK